MPVTLDPDAAAIYQAFQEAGRPAYETLTAPEAREYYLNARVVMNPEPPALGIEQTAFDPRAARRDPGAHLHARRRCARTTALRRAWCSFTAAAG